MAYQQHSFSSLMKKIIHQTSKTRVQPCNATQTREILLTLGGSCNTAYCLTTPMDCPGIRIDLESSDCLMVIVYKLTFNQSLESNEHRLEGNGACSTDHRPGWI